MIDYKKLAAKKGRDYPNAKPVPLADIPKENQRGKYSYYPLPIKKSVPDSNGNSRRWGDASDNVQKKVIDTIVSKATQQGLSTRETAYVLAMAYIESGFNPDAAAGTTSASGLGQFVIDTGEFYGLTYSIFDKNPTHFNISENADALVRAYLDNKKIAINRGNAGRQREERVYQYHHDGPGKKDRDSGEGLTLSKTRVLPIADNIEKALNGTFTGEHVDPERALKKRPSHVPMVPSPRTNKKYIDPSAASRLHPHAAETSAPHQQDYYNTKHWNIASRLYHLYHHDYDPDDGWTD